jgi:hypothetical protein
MELIDEKIGYKISWNCPFNDVDRYIWLFSGLQTGFFFKLAKRIQNFYRNSSELFREYQSFVQNIFWNSRNLQEKNILSKYKQTFYRNLAERITVCFQHNF